MAETLPLFGAVVIGRNEGERLKRCLNSLRDAEAVVYVDSASTDGSVQWARAHCTEVVELDPSLPFSAARARNAGFRRLRELRPELSFVQFVDGDCELVQDWPAAALTFLEAHSEACAVYGRRRERYPEQSVYNWLCDLEWDRPVGEARSFGGDYMARATAIEKAGGYREDVIAAEDDELCVRLRAAGWRIWRIDHEMTWHDAAILRFSQWWRRSVRCGYAFAQGAYLHGAPPELHFVWQSRRAWLWGLWLPLACFAIALAFGPWGWLIWLIYPLQTLRQVIRNDGTWADRVKLAVFQTLARFPEVVGQLRFVRDRSFRRAAQIIEYK